MEIYLVRHTTPDVEKGVCYGQSDIDVVDSFEEEARDVLEKIPYNVNRIVYSSPLLRCEKLAKIISSACIFDECLMELNFGSWELKKWNQIPEEEINPWMKDFVNVSVPEGESYIDLSKRTIAFYKELKHLKKEQIIIVSHGGVIRSLLAYLNKVPLEKSFDIKITYGQVSMIRINENIEVTYAIS